MRCPFCNSPETQVKDSRVSDDGTNIKRRRFCSVCGARFTTFERVQLKEVFVKKSNGFVVPFEREKLTRSITLACRKRPVSEDRIEKIVSAIQRQLESTGDQEISSREIGALAMEMLSRVDIVAYVRFASVYHNFEKPTDFLELIKSAPVLENSSCESETTEEGGEAYNICKIYPRGAGKNGDFELE